MVGNFAKPVPKPVETWAAKVMSSDKEMSGKDVVRKVMKEVGPHLNVRVHEVKAIKSGGFHG